MSRFRAVVLTLAVSLAVGGTAHAGAITLAGGEAGSIPGLNSAANDFIGSLFLGPQIGGYFGSEITVASGTQLLFEFFGAEAGYHNEFNYAGSEVFAHTGGETIASSLGSPLATYTAYGSGGLVFSFDVNSNQASVSNGSNPNDVGGAATGPNFFATCNPFSGQSGAGGTNCKSVYLFLDDGGAGPDDDHDDFLVRITAVPEPGTLALMSLGLAGIVGVRRRR